MSKPLLSLLLSILALPLACSGSTVLVAPLEASYVTMAFEAVDAFGRPIEGIEIRLLQAWQERDDTVYPARGALRSRYTDHRGRALFDSYDLGQSALGFWVDAYGDALLYDLADEDRAVVTVLIGSPTLGWIQVDVPLSFLRPHNDVFLEY